jgi:RNA polymerase sigma-70 factor (ECF subfamily)
VIHSDEERRRRFEVLAAEMLEPVRRYPARRTDRATAEDALSDVLLGCWRRLDEMPPRSGAMGVGRGAQLPSER